MVSKVKRREGEKAREDVEHLFAMAKENVQKEPALANRYVALARKTAKRHRISLRHHNQEHCRKCYTFFTSQTLRVRIRPTMIVRTCMTCGNIMRIARREKTVRKRKMTTKKSSSQTRTQNSQAKE